MTPSDHDQDVPYGEDWQSIAEATVWADASDKKRPWRAQFRDFIAEQIAALPPNARVLELGSGPGFLAERVLEHCNQLANYTLLDFSVPMLAMSRTRLARFSAASFIAANFKLNDWMQLANDPFDCVVSMQAIHEVRHKRHVPALYHQIHGVITTPGLVLICDHTPFGAPDRRVLYMTEQEQLDTLAAAGFTAPDIELSLDGLVLYSGRKTDPSLQRT